MPSLADLLRNDPWGAPPSTPLAKTVNDVGFDPSLGFAGAVQTYLSRLKKMQGGLAQDMLDTAADPNAEGIQRAANLLGGLGLKIANVPMALMPSAQELRDRGYQSGASPEMQAVGGALGDMVNIPEPASVGTLLAGIGKAAVGAKGLAGAAAMAGKSAAVAPLGKGLGSLLADATPAEQAALKARLEAEAAQTGGQAVGVSREQALNGLTGQDGIIAYHGSPHSFDKFDMTKIGTGEGAQAYGHGLYFAENQGVAKEYRDKLAEDIYQTTSGPMFNPSDLQHLNVRNLARTDIDAAIEKAHSVITNSPSKQALDAATSDLAKLQDAKARGATRNTGSMYQVHLDVKPHELLDWDKPLSEQSHIVKKIKPMLERRGGFDRGMDVYGLRKETATGGDLMEAFGRNAEAVSAELKKAGIKGIKYLDQGSRDSRGGTSNFVIFDDKLITILKKYGVPMTAGAAGAMMIKGNDMPPEVASQISG